MRRTLAACALTPFWLAGLTAAALARPLRWVRAAAAEGYDTGVRWKWTPALGLILVALAVAAALLI